MDINISVNNVSSQTRDDLVAALTTAMQAARDECSRSASNSDYANNEAERLTYVAESNRYDDKANALREMILGICTTTAVFVAVTA